MTSVAKENGFRQYEAIVEAPAGYEVAVSPSKFRLKRGETATFEVTITNVDAPGEEWRFGSLKWVDRSGNYEVYSPIAAKSVLIDDSESSEPTGPTEPKDETDQCANLSKKKCMKSDDCTWENSKDGPDCADAAGSGSKQVDGSDEATVKEQPNSGHSTTKHLLAFVAAFMATVWVQWE